MRRAALFALTFLLGASAGWVICRSPRVESAGPRIDLTQPVDIRDPHRRGEGVNARYIPHAVTVAGQPAHVIAAPPLDRPVWILSFAGGEVLVAATVEHY